jgi:hypothetical protein
MADFGFRVLLCKTLPLPAFGGQALVTAASLPPKAGITMDGGSEFKNKHGPTQTKAWN